MACKGVDLLAVCRNHWPDGEASTIRTECPLSVRVSGCHQVPRTVP